VHKLGKKLWNSEHGEGEATGITMAETLSYDFNEMHVNGWVYWQAIDGGAWGLLDCDIENGNVRRPNGKYYVMAQYSRHIRPGMTIMANKHKYTITAYDRSRRMLVIVSVNNVNKVRAINYDLSNFSQVKGPIYGWSTQTDGTGDLYKSFKATDTVQNKQFTAKFGPKHVKTFEIHGVVL
jgi:galactan endo-1,6-beta-galactosidase